MFTHLLMESGFGASFELGRTPKPAGLLPGQQPRPGAWRQGPLCNSTNKSSG